MPPTPAPPILALEGVPGSGKTTLFAALIAALSHEALFFCEPNPILAQVDERVPAPASDAPADLTTWYLDHEAARLAAAPADTARLRLLDRNHLGALAFTYAFKGGSDAMDFATARQRYESTIAPHLDARARTVILLASPDASLTRRGNHPEMPRWELWFDRDLLERLHRFYTEIAPDLCPTPPLVIDTDPLTPAQVWTTLASEVPELGLPAFPPIPAPSVRPAIDPAFAELYRIIGGLGVLGHPASNAFAHRGGLIQLFHLGALHRTPDGRMQIWQPTAHTATGQQKAAS